MSILIESQIAHMLRDSRLKTREREHLEELREHNRRYLEENKDYYPQSPYDFGEGHVRSIVELRVDEVYNVMTRRSESSPFVIAERVKIELIKPKSLFSPATPPYEIIVQALGSDGEMFAIREASDMGLEPLPIIALPTPLQDKAGFIWATDVYTARTEDVNSQST